MAATRVPALAGAALRGRLPAALPPRPVRGAAGRQPLGVALCSASGRDRGGAGPRTQDRPEGEVRRPASEELTAAERRIVDLHAAACASKHQWHVQMGSISLGKKPFLAWGIHRYVISVSITGQLSRRPQVNPQTSLLSFLNKQCPSQCSSICASREGGLLLSPAV
ncbi:uncharacterized protein C1orf53 homolog isoform X2 [Pteropus medius]|uniref:uncharacterized protein C1orf53 homolog isoform X2 n=1 Tax=Pteropus vampyrus TaxID=132908 RepID=UPI00196BB267|nr:uncharacterized protein C1orf53 homolog isoform X2 [Pteropus giganteus]